MLNRAVARVRISTKPRDYEAFEEVIGEAKRCSVLRGAPFGAASWQAVTAKRLGLQSTLRPRGRPGKSPPAEPAAPI